MADKSNPIIDLSSESSDDNNILSMEDELLGTGKAGTNTKTGSSTKSNTATQVQKSKFHIPQIVKDKYANLIPLILQTESMDDEEREYWFQILPIMTSDQISKFKNILVTEKQQLTKLDKDYENELSKINEKHLQEWQEFESKDKLETLAKKEKTAEKEEASEEEALLNKLQNL